MPNYPPLGDKWLSRQLAAMKTAGLAAAGKGTNFVIESLLPKPGEERSPTELAVSVAIIGNLSRDHLGNATGLTGCGIATLDSATGKWRKL